LSGEYSPQFAGIPHGIDSPSRQDQARAVGAESTGNGMADTADCAGE
jgi:hypothetical protein